MQARDSRLESGQVSEIYEVTLRSTLTCISIAVKSASGPLTKPILIPEDRTLDRLSNRRTLPTSGYSHSSEK